MKVIRIEFQVNWKAASHGEKRKVLKENELCINPTTIFLLIK